MFKKILSLFMVFVLCTIINVMSVSAENTEIILQIDNSVMEVNGVEKDVDGEYNTKPVIKDGRTLLPVRAVVEALGGEINWNNNTKEVTLTHDNNIIIILTIDSTEAIFNGKNVIIDTAPIIINGRTMLPIRFIAESFGLNVIWNDIDKTITITANDNTAVTETAAETTTEEISYKDSEAETYDNLNILVAYFTVTGNTKSAAEKISAVTGGDLYEIVPKEPYTDEDINYNNDNSRTSREMSDKSVRPEISGSVENMSEYDIIYLGYPIWWGEAPRIIDTFLESYDFSGKTIFPFCTSGGSSIDGSTNTIKEFLPTAYIGNGKRLSVNASEREIEEWVQGNDIKNS